MGGKARDDEECFTLERGRELLDYNPFSGKLSFNMALGNREVGDAAGYLTKDGYIHVEIEGKRYLIHRIAHLLMTGSRPKGNPEHKNQKGADNRWSNIKDLATGHENTGPIGLRVNNTSGLRGVCWHKNKKKWYAQTTIHGTYIGLGLFEDKEQAGLTWDAAAKLAWSSRFQWLNFLDCFSDHIVLKPRVVKKIEAALGSAVPELAEAA
jgi:hypothetical protein